MKVSVEKILTASTRFTYANLQRAKDSIDYYASEVKCIETSDRTVNLHIIPQMSKNGDISLVNNFNIIDRKKNRNIRKLVFTKTYQSENDMCSRLTSDLQNIVYIYVFREFYTRSTNQTIIDGKMPDEMFFVGGRSNGKSAMSLDHTIDQLRYVTWLLDKDQVAKLIKGIF